MSEDKQANIDKILMQIEANMANRFERKPITIATILNCITSDFVWYCENCEAVGMHRGLEQIQEEAQMHAEPWGANETSDCRMYIIDIEDRKVYGYTTGYEIGTCTCRNCECDQDEADPLQFLYDLEDGEYAGFNPGSEG
jgi:hypothetical protein